MRRHTIRFLVCVLAALSARTTWADQVYTWGGTEAGEFDSPVPVPGLSNAVSIGRGAFHAMAVLSDCTARSWGFNAFGQLGDGTTNSTFTLSPVTVSGLTNVRSITGGYWDSLALLSNGTAAAWGYNFDGELGNGTHTDSHTPVAVGGLTNVRAIAAGDGHSLALLANGTVWGWGDNAYGDLGNNNPFFSQASPVQIPGLTGVAAIASGWRDSLVLLSDGTVRSFGANNYGQLGDGTTTDRSSPVLVPGLTHATAIVAGSGHSLALLSNGTVQAWGDNSHGELGNGTTTSCLTTGAVPGLSNIVDVAASYYASYALARDGQLWAWGANTAGQLGVGDTTDRYSPTKVQPPPGYRFTSIAGADNGFFMLAMVAPVPEPSALALAIVGLAAAALFQLRRRLLRWS